VRIDSGDLLAASRAARALLDEAGHRDATIVVSGDLDEVRIARLVAAGAPIDRWGVGTDLGTSRDSPAVGGVYKLVAHSAGGGGWRGTAKLSPAKATLPGPKQVWRRYADDVMAGDVIGAVEDTHEGESLLSPAMRAGSRAGSKPLEDMRAHAAAQLSALPEHLRRLDPAEGEAPYPVIYSSSLRARTRS
jgi:nicotinate phosphoribosyltransferase